MTCYLAHAAHHYRRGALTSNNRTDNQSPLARCSPCATFACSKGYARRVHLDVRSGPRRGTSLRPQQHVRVLVDATTRGSRTAPSRLDRNHTARPSSICYVCYVMLCRCRQLSGCGPGDSRAKRWPPNRQATRGLLLGGPDGAPRGAPSGKVESSSPCNHQACSRSASTSATAPTTTSGRATRRTRRAARPEPAAASRLQNWPALCGFHSMLS